MEIRVSIAREIVVDGEIDALDVNTTTEHVGGNTYTLIELFELLISFDTVRSSVVC